MTLAVFRSVRNIYLDYNAIALRLDAMAGEIRGAGFDALAVVLRGGAFAGLHLAFLTGLPVHFLRYDRPRAAAEWVGTPPERGRVLLCEDFAGMGRTLTDCQTFLARAGYEVATLVVCKDHLSATVPDYYCFDNQEPGARFLLPWERYRLNFLTGNTSQVDALPDHEYERTAWDLDGIFLADLDHEAYRHDLAATLARRDQLPLSADAPSPAVQDFIVTGRPVSDRERTEAWLNRYAIRVPVIFRDDADSNPTAESVARWKGQRALDLGCTHFVESEAEQAVHIASFYPGMRVIWWNRGTPIAVQGARGSMS